MPRAAHEKMLLRFPEVTRRGQANGRDGRWTNGGKVVAKGLVGRGEPVNNSAHPMGSCNGEIDKMNDQSIQCGCPRSLQSKDDKE